MSKLLYDFFTADHRRIEVLLDRATEDIDNIDEDLYHQFRTGLLKHIKMEEKVLFPAAQKANGGVPLPLAAKLRLDHGALTSLMVVPPSESVIRVIRHILDIHDELEEQSGGMYEACEKLTQGEVFFLLEQLKNITDVPVHPFNRAEYALEATKRAVIRAGFDYDQIIS